MATSGFYRTYPLLQQDFAIDLNRHIDVISTGVQTFSSSVTGISQESNGDVTMRILTRSDHSLSLGAGAVITSPVTVSGVEEETTDCLVESSSTCSQIYTVTIPSDTDCDTIQSSQSTEVMDLSGTFQIAFNPQCRDMDGNEDAVCDIDESETVILDIPSTFTHQICGGLSSIEFDTDFTFYSDDSFGQRIDGTEPVYNELDTIYGQIEVKISSDSETKDQYDVTGATLENLYVCTGEDTGALESSLISDDGTGGCLSSLVDADGLYVVVGNGADTGYQGSKDYDISADNVVRFSFLSFGVNISDVLSML